MKKTVTTLLWFFVLPFIVKAQDENSKKMQDSLFNQARIKYNNGKHDEAVKDFSVILETNSKHVNALLQRGFCYAILKNFNAAIADFTSVIDLEPAHEWAYVSRGGAYNKINEYQKAMDDFNKALELKPEDAEAYNNRGFSKKGLGDFDGACKDWNKSKKLGNEEAKIILKNNRCK